MHTHMIVRASLITALGLSLGCSLGDRARALPVSARADTTRVTTPVPAQTEAAVRQRLGGLALPFIANQGQTDKSVRFYAPTFGGTVFVTTAGEIVYALPGVREDQSKVQSPALVVSGHVRVQGSGFSKPGESALLNPQSTIHNPQSVRPQSHGVVLREALVGGRMQAVTGQGPTPTTVNIFKGQDAGKWQRNLATYNRVSLGEVYDGVEVTLNASGHTVEKLFHVQPGAEPEQIKVRLSGGRGLTVTAQGELAVGTAQGTVRFSKPVAYQEQAGQKALIEVAYVVAGDTYGFQVGTYDRSQALVIDPILTATFLGGSDDDYPYALALDSTGNVYVAGFTHSPDFPGVDSGSADSTLGGTEAFVAKLDATLSSILAATFLGGSGDGDASALALDSTGNVYVAGSTYSADFPGVDSGSADSTFAGDGEAFVAKLDAPLSSILAATFLGGSASDSDSALALDSTGNVYVAGRTGSADFPGVDSGSADSTSDGSEAFVARLDACALVTSLDTDGDGVGDGCDTDDDNDGCLDTSDEAPLNPDEPIGTWTAPLCTPNSGTEYGFAGVDTDRDGLLNCQDPDNDNDGVSDRADACPRTVKATCPFLKPPCPPSWYNLCRIGPCTLLFVKIVSVINPDPTTEARFEHFDIVGDHLYVFANAGQTLQDAADAFIPAPPVLSALQSAEAIVLTEPRRIKVWERASGRGEERFVTALGEYHKVTVRPLKAGDVLRVTLPKRSPQPLRLDAVWAVSAKPNQLVSDSDRDRIPDPSDNCPDDRNPTQADTDQDHLGDACDNPPAGP